MVSSTTGLYTKTWFKANLTFPYGALVFPTVESSWIIAGTAERAVITGTVITVTVAKYLSTHLNLS